MIIRKERPAGAEAITQVTRAAFEAFPISSLTEHHIIRVLRAAGALTLSLVAEIDGQVVGHIAFSPVHISDGTEGWYGLGPIWVAPRYQTQRIGSSLVRNGLSLLRERGAQGCALVGDPEYYAQFGFTNDPASVHEGVPQDAFLVLPFGEQVPQGRVVFQGAFEAEG